MIIIISICNNIVGFIKFLNKIASFTMAIGLLSNISFNSFSKNLNLFKLVDHIEFIHYMRIILIHFL